MHKWSLFISSFLCVLTESCSFSVSILSKHVAPAMVLREHTNSDHNAVVSNNCAAEGWPAGQTHAHEDADDRDTIAINPSGKNQHDTDRCWLERISNTFHREGTNGQKIKDNNKKRINKRDRQTKHKMLRPKR